MWATIKKLSVTNDSMRYCPSWAAPRKKGRPKKDARKLGILDHLQQDVAKRRHRNSIALETIVEEVNKDDAAIVEFEELKLEDTKDGVVGIT